MIRGHIALVRQLRDFMERSRLPWGSVTFRYDHDDDGRIIMDERRAEMEFRHGGRCIEVVIIAPSDDAEGVDRLPLGRLAARCDSGRVVKGPIDQATWDKIVDMINSKCEAA